MITKRKQRIRAGKKDLLIPREDWEATKKNPTLGELIELIENKCHLEESKRVKGKGITLNH